MDNQEFVTREKHESDAKYFDARLDDLKDRIADIKDTSAQQNHSQSVFIGVIAFIFAALQIGIAVVLWMLTHPVK